MKLYGLEQVGCYADGTFGHDHIRSKLQDLLKGLTENDIDLVEKGTNLMCQLEFTSTQMSAIREHYGDCFGDDFSEEDDAIDLLNEHATDDTVYFGMFEGDLVLASNRQWEVGSIYSEEWYGLESGNNVVLESSEV